MKVKVSQMIIEGAEIGGDNPLPILRDHNIDMPCQVDPNIPSEIGESFGKRCAARILPYKEQNKYSRDRKEMTLKTIILENDILVATFLPEYGGRLYSLYNKRQKRELLSVNSIFQPANLALRNAWFSGGIEWNVGQVGHSFHTCSSVFFAAGEHEEYGQFIRLYEYERCKNIFYQIDFYLPQGSEQLISYTKIINHRKEPVDIYYWSNIAVRETSKSRVFSSTKDVIYMKYMDDNFEDKMFSAGELPELDTIQGDASYPQTFSRANEYFFQTDQKTENPWEAISYEDGFTFYEYSSPILRYRKMFCWGTHKGGQRWQDYLSTDGVRYAEIQAGLYPTQLHNDYLEGESTISFMQAFGSFIGEPEALYMEYNVARRYVNDYLRSYCISANVEAMEEALESNSRMPLNNILHHGSGWGALEEMRLAKGKCNTSNHSLVFPESTLNHEQEYWFNVLNGSGDYEEDTLLPLAYMSDMQWMNILSGYKTALSYVHQGIILFENGFINKAKDCLMNSIRTKPNFLAYRLLGNISYKEQRWHEAVNYYECAQLFIKEAMPEEYLIEFIQALIKLEDYTKAWRLYEGHPLLHKIEEVKKAVLPVAYKLNKNQFMADIFKLEQERIREGENTLVDYWYKVNKDEQVEPPYSIDFRLA